MDRVSPCLVTQLGAYTNIYTQTKVQYGALSYLGNESEPKCLYVYDKMFPRQNVLVLY